MAGHDECKRYSFSFVVVLFALSLLCAHLASALQVSPAAVSYTLAPGNVSAYTLHVINDGAEPVLVSVTVPALYQDVVIVSPAAFALEPGRGDVTVTLRHPEEVELSPGRNLLPLMVTAGPNSTGGQFGSVVTLLHNLVVYRPYDGAWLEASLSANDPLPPTRFGLLTLSIANRGKTGTTATATARVADRGRTIATLELGTAHFPPSAEGKLESQWDVSIVPPGAYDATALFHYQDPVRGDVSEERSARVRVGAPTLVFQEPWGSLVAGETARVELPATLAWNENVSAYADVQLEANGAVIASARTPTLLFAPRDSGLFVAFLEVPADAPPNATLTVVAREPRRERSIGEASFLIVLESGLVPTPFGKLSSSTIIILVLAIVSLIVTASIVWWRRREL